jgi:hypothetical protein
MCDKCLELDFMISQCHLLADVEGDELLQAAPVPIVIRVILVALTTSSGHL